MLWVRKAPLIVWLIMGIGIALRLLFLFHQPFTNDEGSYLYDARTLLEGRVPGGDALTKAPVVECSLFFADKPSRQDSWAAAL